jgi:hypothetical protein
MISAFWLLLIIPLSASVGLVMACLLITAGKSESQSIFEGMRGPTWMITRDCEEIKP